MRLCCNLQWRSRLLLVFPTQFFFFKAKTPWCNRNSNSQGIILGKWSPHLSWTCVCVSASSSVKKPFLAKTLQFDTEPHKETPSFEGTVPSSLLHLVGQLAEMAEDKYRLLEQRDKVLRQGLTLWPHWSPWERFSRWHHVSAQVNPRGQTWTCPRCSWARVQTCVLRRRDSWGKRENSSASLRSSETLKW